MVVASSISPTIGTPPERGRILTPCASAGPVLAGIPVEPLEEDCTPDVAWDVIGETTDAAGATGEAAGTAGEAAGAADGAGVTAKAAGVPSAATDRDGGTVGRAGGPAPRSVEIVGRSEDTLGRSGGRVGRSGGGAFDPSNALGPANTPNTVKWSTCVVAMCASVSTVVGSSCHWF